MQRKLLSELPVFIGTAREHLRKVIEIADPIATFRTGPVESAVAAHAEAAQKLSISPDLTSSGKAKQLAEEDAKLASAVNSWANEGLHHLRKNREGLVAQAQRKVASKPGDSTERLLQFLEDQAILDQLEDVDPLLRPVVYTQAPRRWREAMERAGDRIGISERGEVSFSPLVSPLIIADAERLEMEDASPEVAQRVREIDTFIAAIERLRSFVLSGIRDRNGRLPGEDDPVEMAAKGATSV